MSNTCQVCRSPLSRKFFAMFTCISGESRVVTFLTKWSTHLRRSQGCVAQHGKVNGRRPAPEAKEEDAANEQTF